MIPRTCKEPTICWDQVWEHELRASATLFVRLMSARSLRSRSRGSVWSPFAAMCNADEPHCQQRRGRGGEIKGRLRRRRSWHYIPLGPLAVFLNISSLHEGSSVEGGSLV